MSPLIVSVSLGERLGDLKNNINLDFATFKTSILLASQNKILEMSQLVAYSNSVFYSVFRSFRELKPIYVEQ